MEDLVGRVFLAVPIPPEIRMALADRLQDLSIPGRLAPPENWHITLRFLDVVDRVTYERFLSAVDGERRWSFDVGLEGFGAFPRAKKATVFWAGIGKGEQDLALMNEVAEDAALGAGLVPEERPYHPHLTLSRIRPPADVSDLVSEELLLSWRCERLVAYRSHLGRGGASYEPIDFIDLLG